MITGRPQKKLANAKQYFGEHLAQGDYYSEGQQVQGEWFGKGIERLGLDPSAPVTQIAFSRLCDNLHPVTGARLTVRHRRKDRRVFYDFVISAPKSVSLMAITMGDERIVTAHDAACRAAISQMEQVAATRVRQNGQDTERITGEIVAAAFRHDSSRALDPQLHTHCVLFNATWDKTEKRWKALQSQFLFEGNHFFTEVYRNELARSLHALGYRLRNRTHGFEIEGVPQEIIQRFSKRSRVIAQAAETLARSLGKALTNDRRAALAHSTRERKLKGISSHELIAFQLAQLSQEERTTLERLKCQTRVQQQPEVGIEAGTLDAAVETALDFARDHLFERKSVVSPHELLEVALRHARGTVDLEELEAALGKRTELLAVGDKLTTREILSQERRMVALVNEGMESCSPLNARFAGDRRLKDEQRIALKALLCSTDRVTALRGGAGTGKTFLLQEVVRGIEERHEVVVLAPNTAAVEVLRQNGFSRAMTVQRLLCDPAVQQSVRGKVHVVDEAGLMSTTQMLDLLELSRTQQSRVVLSGDTRQHTSVEAGDALRILEGHSALRTAELKNVRRQVDPEYRAAIAEIAAGQANQGLLRLDRQGAIEVATGGERYERLAAAYADSLKQKKTALIVCPTWREIEQVTGFVRQQLQAEGCLSKKATTVIAHDSLNWTTAQKRDLRYFRPGHVLMFHRPARDFAAGDWGVVQSVGCDHLVVRKYSGKRVTVTVKQARCYDVAEEYKLEIAQGEKLLLRANRKEEKLFRGQIVTVKKVGITGRIHLTDGRKLKRNFKAFTHGYAVTSPGSQARTVDHVYVAVDSDSFPAANQKQFYVSVSRGREKVKIYTDDKQFLHSAVRRPGTRLSALELIQRVRRHHATTAERAKETIQPRVAI